MEKSIDMFTKKGARYKKTMESIGVKKSSKEVKAKNISTLLERVILN